MDPRVVQYYRRYSSYLAPIVSDPLVRSYFSLVASLFLTTFLLIFALSPTINTILGLQRKIADQEKTLVAANEKINSLVLASEIYNQLGSSIPLLIKALPDRPEPQVIIADILGVASTSAVTISSLQFEGMSLTGDPVLTSTGSATVVLPFSFSVAGEEPRVRDFLGKLENQLRYLRIPRVSVLIDSKSGKTAADVGGESYYFQPGL